MQPFGYDQIRLTLPRREKAMEIKNGYRVVAFACNKGSVEAYLPSR